MKNYTILLFSILFGFACNRSGTQNDIESSNKGSFQSLIIDYWTGDEYHYNKRMEFKLKNGNIIGKLIEPKYFVGDTIIKPKATILAESDLDFITSFLAKADHYKDTCDENMISSSSEDYTIIIDKDTIEITRFCDWGDYDYNAVESNIFSDFFTCLEERRINLENGLSNKLNGFWVPVLPKKK